jgi:muconolactone delta-isomerase
MEDVVIVVPHDMDKDEIEAFRADTEDAINIAKEKGSYVVQDGYGRTWALC